MFFFFFFSSRRRHTRFDCDWSSDVCSSDLQIRRRSQMNLTLLDGTTIKLPSGRKRPAKADAGEPSSDRQVTAAEMVAALRAAARESDAGEGPGGNPRWEQIVGADLRLLLPKQLIDEG